MLLKFSTNVPPLRKVKHSKKRTLVKTCHSHDKISAIFRTLDCFRKKTGTGALIERIPSIRNRPQNSSNKSSCPTPVVTKNNGYLANNTGTSPSSPKTSFGLKLTKNTSMESTATQLQSPSQLRPGYLKSKKLRMMLKNILCSKDGIELVTLSDIFREFIKCALFGIFFKLVLFVF